jgi:hypothetical protein
LRFCLKAPFGGVIHGSNPCAVAIPYSPRETALVKDLQYGRPSNPRYLHFGTKLPKSVISDCLWGYNWATTEFVKPSFYPLRNCWRVRVPASESEIGKRSAKYFETKEAAEHFIAEHRKTGSIHLAELSVEEKHVLGLIRKSQYYAPELLLDIWRAYVARQQAPPDPSFTVAELCEAFYNRQIKEGRAYRTIADDRWRLNQFAKAVGDMDSNHCTSADIFQYLEAKPPGTNRRSHFKTLKKLWRWAVQSGRVDVDPMSKLRPADEWKVNAEHLSIAVYHRLLASSRHENQAPRKLSQEFVCDLCAYVPINR